MGCGVLGGGVGCGGYNHSTTSIDIQSCIYFLAHIIILIENVCIVIGYSIYVSTYPRSSRMAMHCSGGNENPPERTT